MSDEDYSDYSYVARMPVCGCLVAAIVDAAGHNRKWKKVVGQVVAEWIARGCIVERVQRSVVKIEFTDCYHHDKPAGRKLPGFED